MQELILIISKCVSVKRQSLKEDDIYKFHFRGFYLGQRIRCIHIYLSDLHKGSDQLTKGDDYLLWVKRRKIINEVLEVELIKHKKII